MLRASRHIAEEKARHGASYFGRRARYCRYQRWAMQRP